MRSWFRSVCLVSGAALLVFLACLQGVRAQTVEIYIDAEYTISSDAAEAIELGIRTALSQQNNRLAGEAVTVIPIDHRGNVKRSRRTMDRYLASDRALVIFGGMHSPPYLANRSFVNENNILTLLPWAAAAPITRPAEDAQNWFFRLSVDDSQAGEFLVRHAVDGAGCNAVALLLLDSGWGRAGQVALTEALNRRGMHPTGVEFFASSVGAASARSLALDVGRIQVDCAILFASWNSGAKVVKALHAQRPGLRIFSHWGITGGEFAETVPHQMRTQMQLTVLQTCGLRREKDGSPGIAAALRASGAGVDSLPDLDAAAGFLHGYDLTLILLAAAQQAARTPGWQTGRIAARRIALHHALEALETPVDGLLGRYDPPFAPYSAEAPDAHEALGITDLCMARFDERGRLVDAD